MNTPDPTRPYWTYADLAVLFGLRERRVRERMPQWRREGFPQPLPWCDWQCRWRPSAVLAWKERQENRAGAGGRPQPCLVVNG